MENVLGFDLGASSGRAILAGFDGKKICLKEVHRFDHNFSIMNGRAFWNIISLYDEMKKGLGACEEDIRGIGFDTWGVDCGILSKEGDLLCMPGSYRDPALDDNNMNEALAKMGGEEEAFRQTGIASLAYNTIYKLYYMNKNMPSIMGAADKILMLPNLIEYLFSGQMHTEYSIASTSQMFDMENKKWARELMASLGIKEEWFTEVDFAGRDLGLIRGDIAKETRKNNVHVISVPGHDTACAVAAVPAREEEFTFLSCGTWSLLGISSKTLLKGDNIIKSKISNEGTADGGYRPTVNIIGLWIQNELRRNLAARGEKYSYSEMEKMAREAKPLKCFIRPDDFIQAGDYPEKIRDFCKKTGQEVPETVGELVRCILESLALKYRQTYNSFKEYISWEEKLYMVGGGVQNGLLCQFTANALGIPVITGASEATAVGNVMTQFKSLGMYETSAEKCEILANSFETKEILPEDGDEWNRAFERFERLYEE